MKTSVKNLGLAVGP